ncbi:MAG: T9SS type A sorting domain-containing protein [Flavipsychrobacter sp.]|nr:T9SS type A sorting domain-containing protein [Flavipsychrobacter sp.]
MKKLLLLSLLVAASFSAFAQQYAKVPVNAPGAKIQGEAKVVKPPYRFIGYRNTPSLDLKWQPALTSIISKNPSEYRQLLKELKSQKAHLKQTSDDVPANKSAASTPVLSTNFIGLNAQGGNSPLDNTIAIANNGNIVSMVNSRIAYYTSTGTQTYIQSIYDLINDNQISTNLCDPKVIYSNTDDKFILFAQTCDGVAATSAIILGFSLSNNPQDGWYFYYFTGNPLNDGSWFDYPKIAVSNDEVFVSGNLFYQGGPFNEAVVYQVQKNPAFTGGNILYQVWTGIPGNPFTLLPVSYGQTGSYGPGIYMVSTAGSTGGSNNINLYDISNNIASTTAQLQGWNVNTTTYSVAADAPQPATSKTLDVGDCRALDGFYLNGIIHFVFNTDAGNAWNGINYNRLNVSNNTNVSSVYSEIGVADNCYPSVASIANTTTDKSVIIAYNRVSSSVFPETRVVNCDDNMTWSSSTLVKAGQNCVDHNWVSGNSERWGDYSGICRKYNDNPASVWMAGTYGNAQKYWGTWIAKILGGTVSVPMVAEESGSAKVYPNPIVDQYYVEFESKEKQQVLIEVVDAAGRLVSQLHKGTANAGRNVFSFNKANLSTGTYFLKISNGQTIIKNEKIVIAGQ